MNKEKLVIKVENLVQKYSILGKEFEVLSGLCFKVKENEIVSIEGKSGIGKSTFLNVLGGLTSFYSGSVQVCDIFLENLDELQKESFRKEQISFIFQQHLLLQDFTALENIMIPLLIKKVPLKIAKEESLEMLNKIGLEKQIHSFPYQLSGGESARVGVGRALIAKKKIILADEPTGNLDKNNSEKLMDIILNLQSELNFSLIIVTHDRNIASLAHRRNMLLEGKIVNI